MPVGTAGTKQTTRNLPAWLMYEPFAFFVNKQNNPTNVGLD